jgi:hypothetical protein
MTLYAELQSPVAGFSQGKKPVAELRDWLEDHVDEVIESDDQRLTKLDGLAWTLIGELDRGDRDEASIRTELGAVATPR